MQRAFWTAGGMIVLCSSIILAAQGTLVAQQGGPPTQPRGNSPFPTSGGPGGTPGQQAANLAPAQVNALLTSARNMPGQLSPMIVNPAAAQAGAALVAALRQQKQATMIQRSQGAPSAGPRPSPAYGRAALARAPLTAAVPPSAPRSPMTSGAAIAAPGSVALACTTFKNPIIASVSGQSGNSAVFSQDPAFNPFTIQGCNFGNILGRAQLNYSNGAKLADLSVNSWTDSLIIVQVNPALVNVLDQNNITLVLFPPNQPQGQKSGFRFFAMRREIRLASIPGADIFLRPINDASSRPVQAFYSSPYRGLAQTIATQTGASPSQVIPNIDQGWTAGVDRNDLYRFSPGTDIVSFDRLKPGFVLQRFQIDERNIAVCHVGIGLGDVLTGGALTGLHAAEGVTNYNDGTWQARIYQNAIRVTSAEKHCHATGGNDSSNSSYALNVWVVGPALSPGVSPWQ